MDDAEIHLAAYDTSWPAMFETERAALEHVLSPWLVGPVEHVGSTAIPGLVAKPIIDIMAAIASLDESRPAIDAVGSLDYCYAPYRADRMHWFCKPSPSLRTHHLHLIPFGSRLWQERLAFRDALRRDDALAARYVELKRGLATRFRRDREAYTDGKWPFVRDVVAAALD